MDTLEPEQPGSRRRSDYGVKIVDGVLVLVDRNLGGRSIAEDIDAVIQDMLMLGYQVGRMAIVVRDRSGRWSVLDIGRDLVCRQFVALATEDQTQAVQIAAVRKAYLT